MSVAGGLLILFRMPFGWPAGGKAFGGCLDWGVSSGRVPGDPNWKSLGSWDQ
jgi:hypothetical protein